MVGGVGMILGNSYGIFLRLFAFPSFTPNLLLLSRGSRVRVWPRAPFSENIFAHARTAPLLAPVQQGVAYRADFQ